MMLAADAPRECMNIVVVGHIDHGKSTMIGRLLADTGSLHDGRLEQVRKRSLQVGKQFEYAFLLDTIREEQAQGITINVARVFFKSASRDYMILDAPGHTEFLRNMVTGAAHAQAALLVIDAKEGVQENSRRHGYMLSLLGIKNVIVLINKMDLVAYDQQAYLRIQQEYARFLAGISIVPQLFIPVSGLLGDNIASHASHMPWYSGPTVMQAIDALPAVPVSLNEPFRLYVQDVYTFGQFADGRRCIVGTVECGTLAVGDEVVLFPSGEKSCIKTFEVFAGAPPQTVASGEAIAFTLSQETVVQRGDLLARAQEHLPKVANIISVSLFWLGREPLRQDREYILRIGTAQSVARLVAIDKSIDASTLEIRQEVDSNAENHSIRCNDVAQCTLKLDTAIAFDEVAVSARTSRFVIVDRYRICGGGIITHV